MKDERIIFYLSKIRQAIPFFSPNKECRIEISGIVFLTRTSKNEKKREKELPVECNFLCFSYYTPFS